MVFCFVMYERSDGIDRPGTWLACCAVSNSPTDEVCIPPKITDRAKKASRI
jgi:hypothetical protein